tara:strand:+ start:636 stop:875 length:240 start_codon:yes stop_codon:yes gene_type:complete
MGLIMTKLKDELIYDRIKQKIQNGINQQVTVINDEMSKKPEDISEEIITNLANQFINLASMNGGIALLNNIKPTETTKE